MGRYTKRELAAWWVGQCPACGWEGLSRDCAGGGPVPGQELYRECACPVCDKAGNDVPVTRIPDPVA